MKCLYPIASNDVYVFSMRPIDSRMYCIVCNQRALIIDAIISNESIEFLKGCKLKDITVILTHEHIDHICGVNELRKITDCKVICSSKCADAICNNRKNGAVYFEGMYAFRNINELNQIRKLNLTDYVCFADETFVNNITFFWEEFTVKCIELPGHSIGGIGIIINDKFIFSGDNFIPGIQTVTKLPGGNKKDYENITRPFFSNLPYGSVVFPGHGGDVVVL